MKVEEIWRRWDELILLSAGALLLTGSLYSCQCIIEYSRIERSKSWPTIKYIWNEKADNITNFGKAELSEDELDGSMSEALGLGAYLRRVWELNPNAVKRTENEGDFSFSFWGEVPGMYEYKIEDDATLELPDINGDGIVGYREEVKNYISKTEVKDK